MCLIDDSLRRWVLRHSQIGSGWSRASLSAVSVSRVITLGMWGVSGCCSILPFPDSDICQIFQLRLLCAVQRETEDLWSVQAEVAIVEASKVTRCWQKNVIYANSHEVTPVDTVQEVMEYRSCMYGSLSSVSHSFLASAGLVLYI